MNAKVRLKKYPNRRLYDTESSAYVTLDQVSQIIKEGRFIEVVDAKTGSDVTPFILVQIIMEQVKRNNNILPVSLLHLIIRFGEDILGEFFEKYLEKSIQSYLNYRKNMDEQFRLCMEMGMDFSNIMTGTGFSDLESELEIEPNHEQKQPKESGNESE